MDDISGIIGNLQNMLRAEPLGIKAAAEKLKEQLAPIADELADRIDRAAEELIRQEDQIISFYPAPIVTAAKQG